MFEKLDSQESSDSCFFRRIFIENFDARMGALGGVFLGLQVFMIKYSDGPTLASIAAAEQFVLNFFLGGAMMKLCENLACKYKSKFTAIFLAILIPDIINISCTYGIHYFDKGEVLPIQSTLPTIFWATAAYIWWSLRKRKMLEGS